MKKKTSKRFVSIAEEDYILNISNHIQSLIGKRVRILGQLKMDVNKKNGDVYRKFIPNLIEYASEDMANKLEIKTEYVFGTDAVNDMALEETGMINITGYVEGYDPVVKDQKLFPLPLVLDCTKVDFENEKHVSRVNLFKTFMTSEDGYSKIPIVLNYYRGGQQVEFTEDMLTDQQKAMIEAGLATVDSFKPKGGVVGENVEFFKLINFDLTGDYVGGAIKVCDDEELPTKLYVFDQDVVVDTKNNKIEEKQEVKSQELKNEVDDLFS